MTDHTREPIISVLGHVDHGKTTILDYIRKSVVASREAGGITQHIGATDIPLEVIEEICEGLVKRENIKIPMRGLLFIDTPGHAAFTNLRKRGGSVADLAILVVDVNEGLKPQTEESIEILKGYKTPFVVAANKLDRVPGWQANATLKNQTPRTIDEYNKRVYNLIGELGIRGFDCDIYTNIQDFRKTIAVIPVSGKTGDGMKELLMMLIGLAQTFLKGKLTVGLNSPAKGTILEVKETKGLGTTLDAIIYDGTIRVNDEIVVASRNPVVTKVKALLRPRALDEMRDPKKQFKSVRTVYAASGVKIVAQGLDAAMPGGPVYVGGKELVDQVKREIGEVEFASDDVGVIVKADTLGSLEAMVKILDGEGIRVRRGSIGKLTKQDVIEASVVAKENRYLGVVLVFNAPVLPDARALAQDHAIPLIENKVIYSIIDEYKNWVEKQREYERLQISKCASNPAKVVILPNHIFRQSKPAIVGVEVLSGILCPGARLMGSDGKICGKVKAIQMRGESLEKAEKGDKVALSIDDMIVGKNACEEDILYTFLSNDDLGRLNPDDLTDDEKQLVREIKKMKKA
ncbi:MAG: translation initiation factor IF-2 [Candidatus Altiarchaeota archaeon]|nr:translation initiation factor IF-2 [Candidatus Altiarchaeota archaeon]